MPQCGHAFVQVFVMCLACVVLVAEGCVGVVVHVHLGFFVLGGCCDMYTLCCLKLAQVGLHSCCRFVFSMASQNQTLRAVMAAIRNNDPACLLDHSAIDRLARGLCGAGLCQAAPLLGSELDVGELVAQSMVCEGCGGQLVREATGPKAKICHTSGMLEKVHIPVRCRRQACNLRDVFVWHNYKVQAGKHLFCGDIKHLKCFMVSSTFGCTVDWLLQFHLRLLREHVSFVGEAFVADTFGRAVGCPASLARLRLNISDCWSKWRVAIRLCRTKDDCCDGVSPDQLDLKLPVEACAGQFWDKAQDHFHKTTADSMRARGARVDIQVMDANAKNRRLGCAAPFQQRIHDDALGKCVRAPCPCTPKLGSLFCTGHGQWHGVELPAGSPRVVGHKKTDALESVGHSTLLLNVEDGDETRWVEESDVHPQAMLEYFKRVGAVEMHEQTLRKMNSKKHSKGWAAFVDSALSDMSVFWGGLTPEEREQTLELHSKTFDLSAVICSTHKEGDILKAKCQRTAGVMCVCASDGTILAFRECFGTESLSQRYLFASAVKSLYPELRIMVHDDACHLHKFCANRAGDSAQARAIAPPELRYICDHFHIKGHTDPWCLVTTHPGIPGNAEELVGIRTSVCEFTFTWLSQYKHATKHMSQFGFQWFLLEVIDAHNQFVAQSRTDHLRFCERFVGCKTKKEFA